MGRVTVTKAQLETLLSALLDDARQTMWHDADEDGEPWKHAAECTTKKFRKTLRTFGFVPAGRAALASENEDGG